ncbi:MAG: hypothetical protein ACM3S0_00500 [Acidobacteriota bacterium]
MQNQRGTFLSILLGVNATAIALVTIAFVVDRDIQNSLGIQQDWFSTFVVVLTLARLIALRAIWNLKRWGVYTYFLLECVEVGTGLFVFTSVWTFPVRALGAVPSFLVLLAIYVLALKPKWHLFK